MVHLGGQVEEEVKEVQEEVEEQEQISQLTMATIATDRLTLIAYTFANPRNPMAASTCLRQIQC